LLDRVTTLRPEWAEAWSRRAAAFYQLEDQASALADLHQALSREPRLYDAWAALGHMALASGDKPRALAAFRKALALHPYLDGIKETADKLAPEVDGREL
jgi:Tfp pilus assembly protein PilF